MRVPIVLHSYNGMSGAFDPAVRSLGDGTWQKFSNESQYLLHSFGALWIFFENLMSPDNAPSRPAQVAASPTASAITFSSGSRLLKSSRSLGGIEDGSRKPRMFVADERFSWAEVSKEFNRWRYYSFIYSPAGPILCPHSLALLQVVRYLGSSRGDEV